LAGLKIGSAMNCLANALIGTAAANVAAHEIVNLGVGWFRLLAQSATADMICPDWQ
jgi:hypothetical protein